MKKIHVLALGAVFGATVALQAADAQANWDEHCAKCHAADGSGDTKMGKKLKIRDLTDGKVQEAFTDEDAFKAMKSGVNDEKGKTKMKPIEELSDDDFKALAKHVRTLKK